MSILTANASVREMKVLGWHCLIQVLESESVADASEFILYEEYTELLVGTSIARQRVALRRVKQRHSAILIDHCIDPRYLLCGNRTFSTDTIATLFAFWDALLSC